MKPKNLPQFIYMKQKRWLRWIGLGTLI